MKKGKLSTTEKYVLQAMQHEGASPKKMAEQLGRSEEVVQNYLDELDRLHSTIAKIQQEKAAEVPTGPNARTTMINKSNGGRSVSVMTQASAERADEHRKTVPSKTPNPAIFIPRPNENG